MTILTKIFSLLIIAFLIALSATAQQPICCPEFKLFQDFEPCEKQQQMDTLGPGGQTIEKGCNLRACKHTTHTYYVMPSGGGYTYSWLITGGSPTTATGISNTITWGLGTEALIKIFISNTSTGCKDTLTYKICLEDAPTAGFNMSMTSPICLNQNVNFTNTSIGAVNHYWDFGDGSTSTAINPSHNYTTPGTYSITLTVDNGYPYTPVRDTGSTGASPVRFPCGCRSTITKTITVKNESPLKIEPGCKQMLCAGDTAYYCTPNSCTNYSWSVTGGSIIGGTNSKCVSVVWNGSYPATVTLNSSCGGTCGNTATIQVPVLFPTMPIAGNTIVCPGSLHNYSLPTMPGTYYNWSLSGGGGFLGPNKNTAGVNVKWGTTAGTYTLTCHYTNPHTKCSGKATISVKIVPPYKISGLSKACVGNNFSYVANGPGSWSISPTTGFTPSSFGTGTGITGTWNKPGTYTITAMPAMPTNFCSSPATLVVIVKDTPKLNSIIGSIKICPGGTNMYQISSNMNEGTFYWSTVGGSVVSYMGSHQDSVMITWNSAGPYSIAVSQLVDGCTSSQKTLNVIPYSKPVLTGTITSCMDNILNYTATSDAPLGGYTWSLSNGLGTLQSAQGSNTMQVLWHGAAAGSNTCNLTVTTCGGTATLLITVIPTPPLIITRTGIFCSTAGITLTASIAGATSYSWVRLPSTSAGSTQSINVTQAGTYQCTVVIGGCTTKATFVVLPENLNIAANISTTDKTYWKCNEVINTTLQALPATGYCYKWFKTPALGTIGFPVGSTASTYTATAMGYYYCEISICGTSCIKNTDTIKIEKEGCDPLPPCIPSKIDFIVSPCNPFTFTAIATPAAALGSVHWYFGDGKEAWGTTVTHLYKSIGTYKVCIINSGNATYCRADTCKDVQVALAANYKAVANCNKVSFTNLSQTTIGTMSYVWSMPGATPNTSTAANPVVNYTTGGLHTVTMTVSNGTCSTTYVDTIRTYNIDAAISIPTPICAKTEAPFMAMSSSSWQTYHWDFGDGYISNLQNTNHAYAAAGTYLVQLTTTNPYCSRIDSQLVNVLPELTINIGTDITICPGSTATLNAGLGYGSYQWYKDGVTISGAISASYTTGQTGEYWVEVANGNGCVALSNRKKVLYVSAPVALIKDYKDFHCSGDGSFTLMNAVNIVGNTYAWSGSGPSGFVFSSTATVATVTASTVGQYQFILTITNAAGCSATDTICFYMGKTPTVTITNPAGPLCEGKAHTFIATASPSIAPASYLYLWSNTIKGNTMTTGMPGAFSVVAGNTDGCFATAKTAVIKPRPNVSLFPVGCDTLCLTDTIFFPLPSPVPYGYNINWYDDAGTLVTPVGTGFNLPLAGLSPGIHHFFATVSFGSACADTTGKYDLYLKDCTLEPPCDNCVDFFGSAQIDAAALETSGPYQTMNQNIVLTINKPAKEIRISLADLQYYWNDPSCKNCKITMLERGCLIPGPGGTTIGNLTLVSPATGCNGELVFKGTGLLPAGTYNIPVKISLPLEKNKQCKLIIKKLCYNITLIDSLCRQCIEPVCYSQNAQGVDNCKCKATNDWTNLNMIPTKPGVPKPRNQILCGSTVTDVQMATSYLISGVYNCQGTSCASTVNEINVYNQVNQITYTKQTAVLFETISFDTPGYHTVQLIAYCGTQKCVCNFRVLVAGKADGNDPKDPKDPTGPTVKIPTKMQIDSALKKILPKDFNGGVFISKEDSAIYENYYSVKDMVTEHTSFDLASITKTFTAMAILKMMEDNQLKLDDAVNKYLPSFPVNDVSIRMLLSHTSGIEDYLQFMDAAGWDKNKMMSNEDLLKYITVNPSKIMIHTPGKMFDYSNTNFALLSLVIEKVSGITYAAYMQRTFFDPLKMNDTYILSSENAGKATRSYYKNGSTYSQRYLDFINGDKSIYSTVRDLQKWHKGLRTMFKKSTIELAYTPQGSLPAMTSDYALGWKTIRTTSGLDVWYHTGWWAGSRSLFIRLPKGNVMIAVMSNNNHTTIAEVKRLCDLFGDYKFSNSTVSNF